MDFVRVGFTVSERRACDVIGCHRKTYRYKSRAKDQTALRMRLRELAGVRVRGCATGIDDCISCCGAKGARQS